jgi:hypothetical protein
MLASSQRHGLWKDAVDIDVIHRAVKNAIEATYEEYKLDSNVTNFQDYFERECDLKVVKGYSKKKENMDLRCRMAALDTGQNFNLTMTQALFFST